MSKLKKKIKRAAKDGKITKKELSKITRNTRKAAPKKIAKLVKKSSASKPKKVLKTIKKADKLPPTVKKMVKRASKDGKITKKEVKKIARKHDDKSAKKITKKIKSKTEGKDVDLPKKRLKKIIRNARGKGDGGGDGGSGGGSGGGNGGGGGSDPEDENPVRDEPDDEGETGRGPGGDRPGGGLDDDVELIEGLEEEISNLEGELGETKGERDRYKQLSDRLKKINDFDLSDAQSFKIKYNQKMKWEDFKDLVKQNSEKLYEERKKQKPPERLGDYNQKTTKELKKRMDEIMGKSSSGLFKENSGRFKGGTIGKNKTLRVTRKGNLVERDLSDDPYGFEAMNKAEERYSKIGTKLQKKYDNAMSYIQKDPTKQESTSRGILSSIEDFGKGEGRSKQARIDLGIKSQS